MKKTAQDYFRQDLHFVVQSGDAPLLADLLERYASLKVRHADYDRAASLFGKAAALRNQDRPEWSASTEGASQEIAAAQLGLGVGKYEGAWSMGSNLPVCEAIALALGSEL
jgi:hypothetical protein